MDKYTNRKSLQLDKELHKQLKMVALKHDKTLKELLEEIINEYLNGRTN